MLFGADEVPDRKAERFIRIGRTNDVREKKLDELDGQFGEEAVRLRELAAQYARAHRLYDEGSS